MQISSIISTLLLALGFLFNTLPYNYSPSAPIISDVVVQHVVEEEVEEPQFLVERSSWFTDSFDTGSWHSLAAMYGHAPELSPLERVEIAPMFEKFDRDISDMISNWTPIPEDWF